VKKLNKPFGSPPAGKKASGLSRWSRDHTAEMDNPPVRNVHSSKVIAQERDQKEYATITLATTS
jgi:hypothetical protein